MSYLHLNLILFQLQFIWIQLRLQYYTYISEYSFNTWIFNSIKVQHVSTIHECSGLGFGEALQDHHRLSQTTVRALGQFSCRLHELFSPKSANETAEIYPPHNLWFKVLHWNVFIIWLIIWSSSSWALWGTNYLNQSVIFHYSTFPNRCVGHVTLFF